MKKTENYAMPYPEQDDYFNVEDFQDMMVSVDNLMKKLSDSGAQISSDAEHLYNQTKAQMDNIQKRMNTFTSLKDGSTIGDAELKDIRVAYDGKEYGNAGEAVREQASDIHKALFGAGASIWSKAKAESTWYTSEEKGICILNERFTAAGVVTKISRGTFAENESTLNLDKECSAYIVEFEKTPGTVYMPSAETIKIVSTAKIIFEANGNARCWIPVEKGQYLAVDSTATAYTCESNHVPYMLYDQANKTLEYRGFGSTGSIEPVDPYSLALEYKLEYDMDDTGLVKQIDANREDAASLKEDIVNTKDGLSNKSYIEKAQFEMGYISGDNGEKGNNNINARSKIIHLNIGDKYKIFIEKGNCVLHLYDNGIWQKYVSSSVDFCNEGYGIIIVKSSEWDVTITKECDVCFVVSRKNNAEITDIAQAYEIITISKEYNYKRIDNLEKGVSELTTDTVLLKENKCDYPSTLKKQNIDILDGIIRDDGILVNTQDNTNKHIEISISSHYDKGSICVSGSCLWKNNMPFLLFLNDNSEVLETYGYDTGKFYENYVIDSVPVGCTKIVVNCQTEVGYLQYLLKTNLSVEEYIDNKFEESKTKNDSYWTGKKIVWFGTSIPAGVVNAGESGGNGSYPVRVGEMLGATVYNESVGSSAVRIGMHDAITNDDINGYSGCPATCCLFSLSGTVDEKKEIVSNWSTWKNKFSIGAETIDSIISRGEEQEQIYDRSYEVKLSKYLSGGLVGQCDLYVIDHGYNDAGNNNGNDYSDLKNIPLDTLDRTYFIGAMNYIINKIKTDNFRASICIVSHYNDEGVFNNLVEAQRYVADYWNIPFIEIYDKIGFSTSSKITINGVTKTVKDWWLTDGIHPSSDTTGEALKHYAEVLYPLIRDVR